MIIKETLRHPLIRGIIIFLGICALGLYLLCCGCASVTVNPETGEVSYYRIGNQTVQGVEITTPNGWVVKFSQDSKTEAMKTVLSIAEALK